MKLSTSNKKRITGLLGVILLLGLTTACPMSNKEKSKTRQMLEQSDRIADYSIATTKTITALNDTEHFRQVTLDKWINAIQEINNSNRAVNESLKELIASGTIDRLKVLTILEKLDALKKILNIFNNQVIMRETNNKVKVILAALYTTSLIAVGTIEGIYMGMEVAKYIPLIPTNYQEVRING